MDSKDISEYRKNLENLTYSELIESHIYEGKIRYQLEEIITKQGFRMNSAGDWEKDR